MKILAVDPGHSTGWAVGENGDLVTAGTTSLDEFVDAVGLALGVGTELGMTDPTLVETLQGTDHVVMEDWSLYPWMLEKLAWDPCLTARGIGALQYICRTAGVPYSLQAAKIKETAIAAGAELWYSRPLHENRHQNDACQHLCYYYLKNGKVPEKRSQAGV